MKIRKVTAITHRWCSCACCVPFGTAMPGQTEAFADMCEVTLDNGLVVTTSYCNEGDTVYFYEDMWWTMPEEPVCSDHMKHQDEGGRCLICGYGY